MVETTVCGQWRMGQQLHRVRHDRLVVLLAEPHRGPVAGPVQALSRSVHRDHGSEHANGKMAMANGRSMRRIVSPHSGMLGLHGTNDDGSNELLPP